MQKHKNLNHVMEFGNHFKNKVCLKSQMSKGSILMNIRFLSLMFLIGFGSASCQQSSQKIIKEKALQGDAESQFLLGEMYCVDKDTLQAATWLKKSLEQGFDVKGHYDKNEISNKANIFLQIGDFFVGKNDTQEALYWLRKSANLENVGAQLALGISSVMGIVGEADNDIALYWLERAISNPDFENSNRKDIEDFIEKLRNSGCDSSRGNAKDILSQNSSNIVDFIDFSYDKETKILTIKGKGKMPDYKYKEKPWEIYKGEIQKVIIEDGITYISENSFWGHSNITSVTIPNTVISIGGLAFEHTKLMSVFIPASVIYIGHIAFTCEIAVSENNPYLSSENGVLFDKKKEKLYSYPKNSLVKYYAIPNTVQEIEAMAFVSIQNLTSVKIPASVKKIGKFAFTGGGELTEIIVEWNKPLILDGDGGINIPKSFGLKNCTLKVPRGTKFAYQAANEWKDFGTIIEY